MGRRFVTLAPGRTADQQDPELTIITYNLLADKYATSGVHAYAPDEHLAWSSRWPRIVRELQSYDADVLCLQEVERPVFETQLLPALPNYSGTFYGRAVGPRDRVQGPEEGVALLTKRGRVEVTAQQSIRFADHVPSGWPAGACRAELEARQDGAVFALCRDTELRRQFVAAATHLHWDPRWPDVKLLQATILSEQLAGFLQQQKPSAHGEPLPVLLAGDFNSLWRKARSDPFDEVPPGTALISGVYKLLSTGAVSRRHTDHPLQRSAWRKKEEPAWKEVGWGWAVTQLLELPYKADAGADAADVPDFAPMPNDEFPSDHLAMGARLIAPCPLLSL